MKKLLLILLCLPMIGLGQSNTEIDARIKNTKYTIIKLPKMLYEANFDYFIDELSNLGFNIIENTEGINKCEILYIDVIVKKDANWLNCGSLKIEFKDCDGNAVYYKNKIRVPNAICNAPYNCCYSQYGQVLLYTVKGDFDELVSDVKAHQYKKIAPKKEDLTNYEALLQLANLKKEGILSEEEFDIEKRKILGLDDNAKEEVKKSTKISSLVDNRIPTNKKVNNRYALIIGNEDYTSFQRTLSSEQNVDFAVNDATIFRQYCLKTLGVKEENMNFLANATAGAMNQKINKMLILMNKLGDEAELIFYYAGHGYPDERTKAPYLIPVDVSGTDLSYAIKLEDLYRDLGNTNARVTVFLDACFTGGGRNSGLVASRGVKVKPKEGTLNGNIVVFSASSGDQSALPYLQQGHGMFTYHLLKKLQESKGKVSMGELANYITNEVSIQSININEKEQDPTINTSSKVMNDWRNWKF